MHKIIIGLFRLTRKIFIKTFILVTKLISKVILLGNGVKFGKNITIKGLISVDVRRGGVMTVGNNFSLNNGSFFNKIGRQQNSIFVVQEDAILKIGNNVGMSSVAIVCSKKVTIGNYVKIGGSTVIYDTDFHSLDYKTRADNVLDKQYVKKSEVSIGDNAFIGAHCIILKGVAIGEGAIVGAGSVVTKSIPPFEIWGGNPAKFIKKIN